MVVSRFPWLIKSSVKIGEVEDYKDSTPHDTVSPGWRPDEIAKARRLVPVYLCCEVRLPAGQPGLIFFGKMWAAALRSVRAEGVFKRPLFVQENEVSAVDIDESTKPLWRSCSLSRTRLLFFVVGKPPEPYSPTSTTVCTGSTRRHPLRPQARRQEN